MCIYIYIYIYIYAHTSSCNAFADAYAIAVRISLKYGVAHCTKHHICKRLHACMHARVRTFMHAEVALRNVSHVGLGSGIRATGVGATNSRTVFTDPCVGFIPSCLASFFVDACASFDDVCTGPAQWAGPGGWPLRQACIPLGLWLQFLVHKTLLLTMTMGPAHRGWTKGGGARHWT